MHCCKIDCEESAAFVIRDLSDRDCYTAETHACTAHVADLLGHAPHVQAPAGRWQIETLTVVA